MSSEKDYEALRQAFIQCVKENQALPAHAEQVVDDYEQRVKHGKDKTW